MGRLIAASSNGVGAAVFRSCSCSKERKFRDGPACLLGLVAEEVVELTKHGKDGQQVHQSTCLN
jgi:hypothetical protein